MGLVNGVEETVIGLEIGKCEWEGWTEKNGVVDAYSIFPLYR